MNESANERLLALRAMIEQQRNTIELLKREGHVCTDAERQLRQMIAELQSTESPSRA